MLGLYTVEAITIHNGIGARYFIILHTILFWGIVAPNSSQLRLYHAGDTSIQQQLAIHGNHDLEVDKALLRLL